MTSHLLAGPATEPVALADAKAFLRLDATDEDDLIETLIAAARIHVESVTAQALVDQTWRLVLDGWPAGRVIRLPVAPLIAVTSITAYDPDGAATAIPLDDVLTEAGVVPARLFLPQTIPDAPVLRQRQGVEIDYKAGYGAGAEDVPAGLKQAVLSLVGHWFEHRDAVAVAGSRAVVPTGFDRLVAPYRQVAL